MEAGEEVVGRVRGSGADTRGEWGIGEDTGVRSIEFWVGGKGEGGVNEF